MPVMEGKAMLFKEFAGIDAYPICVRAGSPDVVVEVARAVAPGGVSSATPSMATPSAQFSLTLRVELPHESGTVAKVTAAITEVGGAIVAVDTVEADGEGTLREITIDCESQEHRGLVIKAVEGVPDAKLIETTDRTFELHRRG